MNVVVVQGRLSRPVEERVLPSGDRLATLDLTVPGPPGSQGARSRAESVPLAWFDAPTWVLDLEPDVEVVAMGRVRRRFFRAGPALQSRTEVVVVAAAPLRRPARVAEVLRRAAGALDDATMASPVPVAPRRRRGAGER